jgi:hypothetical protein
VTIEHPLLLDNVTLANILINFGQQLLSAQVGNPNQDRTGESQIAAERAATLKSARGTGA